MIKKTPVTPDKALMRLEALCARSEHSCGELRQKLRLWGVSACDEEKIIASLQQRKFVDDERFARAYVRDKLRFSHWGRVKIRVGLIAKRVSSPIIAIAISEEISVEEYESTLVSVLRTKMRAIEDADSYDGRTRLFRFGVSRGFEPGEVSRVLRSKELWES